MAKKTKSAIGLSFLALILGVVIGSGCSFGVTTATYNTETNDKNNASRNDVSSVSEGIVYDNFQVHFLELGNKYAGDATYIKAGDVDILIDGGSRASSAETISNYINQYCTDGKLEYVIATHAHQDHIAALVGNSSSKYEGGKDGILYRYTIDNLIYFAQTNNESSALCKNFRATVTYLTSKGTNCSTADVAYLNSSKINFNEDMSMSILYNYYYFEPSNDENDHSVITMLTYKTHNFLFTGDLEEKGETAFANHYKNDEPNVLPSSFDLFKGGHHGSKTSSNDVLLELIHPQICCVCCCAGCTEYTTYRENTFPTQKFIDRIAKYTQAVYVTSMWNDEKETFESMNGNIIISCNGTEVSVAASNNLTKLKDTAWFSHTVYVDDKDRIVKQGTTGAKPVACRTLPNEWK